MSYYWIQQVHCGVFTLSLQIVHYFHPEWDKFCEVQVFPFQYLTSVELPFLVSMCLVLFFETLRVITSSRLVKYYAVARNSRN